ncbi:MAG: hypothetical protein RL199_441 [Pseudomonadota bacterium]|jgi:hypothetical protein
MRAKTGNLERWFEDQRETQGLKLEATPREMARRLASKETLFERVENLDPPARALLRLVCRVHRAGRLTDWDAASFALFGQRAAARLIDVGLAFLDGERMPRLHVPEPLRATLAEFCTPPCREPLPAPRPEAASHERETCFRFGMVLAVLEQLRPRVSGHVALHKSDRAHVVALVAPAFARAESADGMVDLALRHGFLRRQGPRFGVDFAAVDAADDLGARLAADLLERREARPGLPAALATLAFDDHWHPLPVLLETAAAAALDEPFAPGVGAEVALLRDRLPRWPGVGALEHDGVVHLRLTGLGRRALGLEAPVPRHEKALFVQPNLELVAEPGLDARALARLGRLARVTSVGGAAVFRLNEETVRRAAAEGFDGEAMRAFLAVHSPRPLPPNVVRTIADWAAVKGTTRVVTGTVLISDAGELALRRALKGIELRALGSGLWLVPSRKADAAARALAAAGLRCERVDADEAAEPNAGDDAARGSWRVRMDEQLARGRKALERMGAR